MKRTVMIALAAVMLWTFVNASFTSLADEIRNDYSTYINDVRSGKANEENLPAGLLEKLKKMGKGSKRHSPDAPAAQPPANGGSASKGSASGNVSSSPPGDVIIIRKSGRNDQ